MWDDGGGGRGSTSGAMYVKLSSARVGDNLVVVGGAETAIDWGRGCGMVVKGSGARACWDNLG